MAETSLLALVMMYALSFSRHLISGVKGRSSATLDVPMNSWMRLFCSAGCTKRKYIWKVPSHDCSTDHVVDERKHILDGIVVVDLVEQAQEQDSISAALLQKTKKKAFNYQAAPPCKVHTRSSRPFCTNWSCLSYSLMSLYSSSLIKLALR